MFYDVIGDKSVTKYKCVSNHIIGRLKFQKIISFLSAQNLYVLFKASPN